MSKGIIKSWQSSTMPKLRKVSGITDEQRLIFNQLVQLLQPYANGLDVRKNNSQEYELWTKHNFRSLSMNPKNKRGTLFAGALIMKKHIGFYFYPLYIHSELSAVVDETIRPFWKGNSAFHFHKPLTDLIAVRLTWLINAGWQYYYHKKWIF